MTENALTDTPEAPAERSKIASLASMLVRDPVALVSLLVLVIMVLFALIGPIFLGREATTINLRARNLPPFTMDNGWTYILGADSLGRSMLARIIVGAQTTFTIAASAVLTSMVVGA